MKKITESQLRDIISKTINESVFGLNGNNLQAMGLKNPADDYPVNYQEAIQKCEEFLPILTEFYQYIYGIEEDSKNGIEEKPGFYHNMRMRGIWNDDEDESYYGEQLRDLAYSLDKTKDVIEEFIDFAINR